MINKTIDQVIQTWKAKYYHTGDEALDNIMDNIPRGAIQFI